MVYISHRGNIEGSILERENEPSYIQEALDQGYDVEVDVWWNDIYGFILGHDKPQYNISKEFLTNIHLWCHAKNKEAFEKMLQINCRCFWHTNEKYILTNKTEILVYPGETLIKNSIAVLPEITAYSDKELKICKGICSDIIKQYKRI